LATRKRRTPALRLVLGAGVAVMPLAGSVVIRSPSEASAEPVSCEVQMNIAWGYLSLANTMDTLDYTNLSSYSYGMDEALADAFYSR
jgi:hypothetical protein